MNYSRKGISILVAVIIVLNSIYGAINHKFKYLLGPLEMDLHWPLYFWPGGFYFIVFWYLMQALGLSVLIYLLLPKKVKDV